MNKGISLISLIITIIVIIILAAVVIFTGLGTPDQANFAKFTSEFSDFDTAVQTDYANKYAEHALKNETRSKAQIYYEIANGGNIEMDKEPEAVGEVQNLGLDLRGGEILGTEYYEITNDTNVDKWNRDKFYYEPEERHFVTDAGTVFTMPGYLMEENGEQRWFINSKTYYVGNKAVISGGRASEQIEPTDIYVKLYTDGTLNFSNNDSVTEGKTVEKDYGNIKGMEFTVVDGTTTAPWFADRNFITSVVVENKVAPTKMAWWFGGLSKVTSLNLNNLNTSNTTNMCGMFNGCRSLLSLDLSGFNTSKVTDMSEMFTSCSKLENLNLSSFDTGNVTDMYAMFCDVGLKTLDLRNFDTRNVTNMQAMFNYCLVLESIDIRGWNTSKVTNMSNMFDSLPELIELKLGNIDTGNVKSMNNMFNCCIKLASMEVSSFNTSKVTDMCHMFSHCRQLLSLNLSSFDTSQVTDMSYMFYDCPTLINIYISDTFIVDMVSNSKYMFTGCTSLKGGNVTVYTSTKTDKTYARIDGKDGLPGYFTDIKDKI